MKHYIKQIFDKESTVSSKRIAGVAIVIWSILAATGFVLFKSHQTEEAKSLIEFMVASGVGLIGAGILDKKK